MLAAIKYAMHNDFRTDAKCLYLFLLCSTWMRTAAASTEPEGTDNRRQLIHDFPKLIQQPAGYDIRLRCGIHGSHADFMEHSNVFWDFKRCSEGFRQTSCRNYQDKWPDNSTTSTSEWTNISCDEKPCKANLLIASPTERQSGLYRCSIQPYRPNDETTLQIQVVKTYQLDVINYTIAAPELLDNVPANTTAIVDTQVVLLCRVHSKVLPTIKWFRRQDVTVAGSFSLSESDGGIVVDGIGAAASDADTAKVVQFYENTYEHLESADARGHTENTYLSKLIFNPVTERDAGLYVCVGINYRGYNWREAYLNVVYADDEGATAADTFGTKELLLLFLIPIGLAMLPLTIWTCYVVLRKPVHPKTAKENRKYSTVCQNEVYV